MAQKPLVGQGLPIIKATGSYSDTPHSVGLLWTSDKPDAKTSIWQYTTLTRTRDGQSMLRRDSNPQSKQARGRRPTLLNARPLSSAPKYVCMYVCMHAYVCVYTHTHTHTHIHTHSHTQAYINILKRTHARTHTHTHTHKYQKMRSNS